MKPIGLTKKSGGVIVVVGVVIVCMAVSIPVGTSTIRMISPVFNTPAEICVLLIGNCCKE